MSAVTMPAVSECAASGCSFNHDGCRAFAITVADSSGCGTFVQLTRKGGLDTVKAQVGACLRAECAHNADLECTADSVRMGAGADGATCLTFAQA